jgi:hypothetical protein
MRDHELMIAHAPSDPAELELSSQTLGALPVVGQFLGRMRVGALLERYLPPRDARCALQPARAIGLLVRNLCVSHQPLYRLGEWAAPFDPSVLGLSAEEVWLLGDDQVGRALDRLFCAERASLLSELMLSVIAAFQVDCSQLHNDSTSISVHGAYRSADGHESAGQPTPKVCHGHNKDHRPDLKQLLWILTVSADGALPLAYRLADGNTNDDQTHIATWEALRALVGYASFLYVADCKLCTREQMGHIDQHGGRFVTVLPRSRKEDGLLRDWAQTNTPQWSEAERKPGKRTDDPDLVWCTAPAPIPSAEGYRIIWVRSSAKIGRDAQARQHRIERAIKALAERAERLAGPKSRLTHPPGGRAGRRRRAHPGQRRALDHLHRHRNRPGDLQTGETRSARQGHPLPQAHHHPLQHRAHRQRRDRRLRRPHRRMLPADHQRPRTHRRRATRRLPLPAQPREAPPPAQVRPRRSPGTAPQPRTDRGAVLLPLHRAAVLLFDRT